MTGEKFKETWNSLYRKRPGFGPAQRGVESVNLTKWIDMISTSYVGLGPEFFIKGCLDALPAVRT